MKPKAEQVPWTLQQTYLGILFTVVPWLIFSLVLSTEVNKPVRTLTPQQDQAGAVVTFVFAIMVEATFLIAPFYFARRGSATRDRQQRQGALQALGLRRCPLWQAILLVLLCFGLIWLINAGYGYLIAWVHRLFPSVTIQTNDLRLCAQSKVAPISTDATLLVAFLVAPICEELFFRGFVFMGLRRGLSLKWAVIVSALIFATAHADAASFLVLLLIGILLAMLRWYSGSLWPSIALHMLNNGNGALLIFLASLGVNGVC